MPEVHVLVAAYGDDTAHTRTYPVTTASLRPTGSRLLTAPSTTNAPDHWEVVEELCTDGDARGNLVADAAHAATAREAGATWVSFDRDFARFPGLSWRTP